MKLTSAKNLDEPQAQPRVVVVPSKDRRIHEAADGGAVAAEPEVG
jgi:hypothetical protein